MRLPKRMTRPLEERMLKDAQWRVRGELAELAALQAKAKRAEESYKANGRERPMTLATVTFEDLRDLGLSMTDSMRVLDSRYRGHLGGLGDLETVRGLSRKTRATLASALPE